MHGHTIDQIIESGIHVDFQISSLISADHPEDIATAYALTAMKFGDFWKQYQHEFDVVIVLGDRFEMAAAVAAGIPFNIRFAHIHGGETTLGAIDNIYRHSITLASKFHFVSALPYTKRIEELTGSKEYCYLVGALGLAGISEVRELNIDEFKSKWNIDLNIPSILVTAHPETIGFKRNKEFSEQLYLALSHLSQANQIVVTMPNADTAGSIFRKMFTDLKQTSPYQFHLIENFGSQSYFSCMRHCKLLIGNTSSGITEAASFNKYVINLGDRQKGRLTSENVIHIPFESQAIINATESYLGKSFKGENIYFKPNTALTIKSVIKSELS
jgi:GDP/UDP-N,N'-diacetylbacillosamine 2-epimerase (hydrolysing)